MGLFRTINSVRNGRRALQRTSSAPITMEVIMARTVSNFMTRRSVVAGLALTAAPLTVLARADKANAQAKQAAPEKACTSGWEVSSPSRRWSITSAMPS